MYKIGCCSELPKQNPAELILVQLRVLGARECEGYCGCGFASVFCFHSVGSQNHTKYVKLGLRTAKTHRIQRDFIFSLQMSIPPRMPSN